MLWKYWKIFLYLSHILTLDTCISSNAFLQNSSQKQSSKFIFASNRMSSHISAVIKLVRRYICVKNSRKILLRLILHSSEITGQGKSQFEWENSNVFYVSSNMKNLFVVPVKYIPFGRVIYIYTIDVICITVHYIVCIQHTRHTKIAFF